MRAPEPGISGLIHVPFIGWLARLEHPFDTLKTAVTHPAVRTDWELVFATGTAKAPAKPREIADIRDLGWRGQARREERQDLPGGFLGKAEQARMDVLLAGREDRRDGLDLVDELHDVRTIRQISITDRNIAQGNAEVLDERGRVALGQGQWWRGSSEFHWGSLP
jgi:hypothetical protein